MTTTAISKDTVPTSAPLLPYYMGTTHLPPLHAASSSGNLATVKRLLKPLRGTALERASNMREPKVRRGGEALAVCICGGIVSFLCTPSLLALCYV